MENITETQERKALRRQEEDLCRKAQLNRVLGLKGWARVIWTVAF